MPKSIARAALAAGLIVPFPALAQQAPPLLAGIFRDHAVLQRDRPIAVWGTAPKGAGEVRVTLGTASTVAKPDKSGGWHAELPTLAAGGPYTLTAATRSGRTQTLNDILIGDVWLCSGQSNMEFAVAQGLNANFEIANADDPHMRLLKVEHDTRSDPKSEFRTPIAWRPATPDSVRTFSAACYFMARDLRGEQKAPIGLIDAAWGGSAIDAWRSEASLGADPGAADGLALLRTYRTDPAKAAARFGTPWAAWWRARTHDAPGTEPWQADARGDWQPVPKFEFWESWGVPALAKYDGIVWYRTQVTLTAAQAAKPATLALAIADDLDMTFVNSVAVGTTNDPSNPRAYPLAPGTLHAGVNRIAVGVVDTFAGGGLHGAADQQAIRFADGSAAPLPDAPGWQYRITPGTGEPPHAPWEAIAGMASIYNGMIAPLGAYGLRGVAWYQGESDASWPDRYAAQLASLMSGWRTQFARNDLPFLIVQLPSWGARNTRPSESGFATIRDQQRRAVEADSHAALVTTIDLGDVVDLHPKNKQDVGHRLARAADMVAYDVPMPKTWGPTVSLARRIGGKVLVAFDSVDTSLVTYSSDLAIGFELCGAAPGSCRFVAGHLEGANVVMLDTTDGPTDRVRFCWGDSPVCNLSDASGIPAEPFELAIE